jgi:hypothetical protein
MPESKRTEKRRPTRLRTARQKIAEPPVIEPLPFHREAYYAGLGLLDWAAEHAGRLPAKLRVIEKELVGRGQHPNAALAKQLDAACVELGRRGKQIQNGARERFRNIWDAVRGTPRDEATRASAPSGAA